MDSGNSEHHPRTVTGNQIAEKARELLGVPFLHQGRTVHGIDCVGVPIWILSEFGLLPAEMKRNYGRIPTGEMIKIVEQYCTPIDRDEIGSLLVIKWPGMADPGHAAIRTHAGILHAYSTYKSVVEHGYRAKWPQWTDSIWRLPGVTS